MQIRPLQPADLDLIDEIDATLDSATYLHVERHAEGLSARFAIEERPLPTRRIEPMPIGDELRFSMKQIANSIEDGTGFIAEHDGVPIAALLARPSPTNDLVELIDVRVDFDRRREGLASAMLFQLITAARNNEARAIRADVQSTNVPLARLLAKLGFECAGLDTQRHTNHDLVKERSTLIWYLAMN